LAIARRLDVARDFFLSLSREMPRRLAAGNCVFRSFAVLSLAAIFAAAPAARADAHGGSWAAKATLGSPSWTQIYGVANVTQNTNYIATVWVKGSGALTFIVNNPAWTYFPASTAVIATSTWTQVQLSFNSGNNTQIVFRFYDDQASSAGSVMYIDDGFLGVSGVSGGGNLLGNPGFETGAGGWITGSAFSIGQFGGGSPPLASGTYRISPLNAGGECLDVSGQNTGNGANVQLWQYLGQSNQQWILTNITGNVYRLSPAHASGECLDVEGQHTASGTNVQIWQYLAQANQQWAIAAVGGGYTLVPQHATGLRLNYTGTADGANVNVTTGNGASSQTWIFTAVSGGGGGSETIGGGTIGSPAVGPAPSYGIGGAGFVLVKNWNFGTGGTIKNRTDLNQEFQYTDQFNQPAGGGNQYGSLFVGSDSSHPSVSGRYDGGPGTPNTRDFLTDTLRTYLVPLDSASSIFPGSQNVGCGSVVSKWTLPTGGSRLGQDIVWETRVRFVPLQEFWFAIWSSGNKWDSGAEIDTVEAFGWDHGGGATNWAGRLWHSDSVGGTEFQYPNFLYDWPGGMSAAGIDPGTYDPTQFHTWTLLYKKDDTWATYVDGVQVQSGSIIWSNGASSGGETIDMRFELDGAWGHWGIGGDMNVSIPASTLSGKYYDWDYSRVYLRN
jgi:hypothetical protein